MNLNEKLLVPSTTVSTLRTRDNEDAAIHGLRRIRSTPFMHRTVTTITGRAIEANGVRVADFAHCGYLGVDHDLSEEDITLAKYWGLRNGWSRITGSTTLSRTLEIELEHLLRFPEVRLGQSISLINLTTFYALAKYFKIFLVERDIHLTLRYGIQSATERQSHLTYQWNQSDLEGLENQLASLPYHTPKLIAVDGVYSMKGTSAPINALMNLCVNYNAVLFVDDAHGFGVEGNNGYGVLEQLSSFDPNRVIYVGSFSKCTSNPVAFIAFSTLFRDLIDGYAPFLIFSGPPSNVHIATALRHLRNFSGQDFTHRRLRLKQLSKRIHDACAAQHVDVLSTSGSPIVTMKLNPDRMEEAVDRFYSSGILGKPAIYPVVRRGDEVLRFTISATHSDTEVDQLIKLATRTNLGWSSP